MDKMKHVVLTAAGIATAGLFGLTVSDFQGCAQSSQMSNSNELSADEYQQIRRKLIIQATLNDRNASEDIEADITRYANGLKNAKAAGIKVSNYELGAFIHEKFEGKDRYAQYCQYMQQRYGLETSEFEDYLRDQLTLAKAAQLPQLAYYVTTAELKSAFHSRHDVLKYDSVVVDASALKLSAELTDKEIKAYYEENSTQAEYQVPEKVSVSYLFVNAEKLKVATPSQEDLLQNYNLNKERYSTSGNAAEAKPFDEVKKEVLVAVEKQNKEDKAKKILNELDNMLISQQEADLFGTLATEKTKNKQFDVVESGNTELFSQKDYKVEPLGYVYNLASRLFGEKPRNYGGVLEAANGFYIYKVNQREAKHTLSLELAKAQVVKALTAQRQMELAVTLAKEWKEKLLAEANWSKLTLPTGLKFESKESEGITSEEASHLNLLAPNVVAEPLKLKGEVAILRLKERVAADEAKFPAEKESLRRGLQQQKMYMTMGMNMGMMGGMGMNSFSGGM